MYRYRYHVRWSPEDGEFVATCEEFPSMSWLDELPHLALKGLEDALEFAISDMIACGESVPLPQS